MRASHRATLTVPRTNSRLKVFIFRVRVFVIFKSKFPSFGDELFADDDDAHAVFVGHAAVRERHFIIQLATFIHATSERKEHRDVKRCRQSTIHRIKRANERVTSNAFGRDISAHELPRFHKLLKSVQRLHRRQPNVRHHLSNARKHTSPNEPMVSNNQTCALSCFAVVSRGTSKSNSSKAKVFVTMLVFQYRLHLSTCNRGLMCTRIVWSSFKRCEMCRRRNARARASSVSINSLC